MVQTKLANHISCLDVSPTGEYPDYSHGAAVGLWNGSVMILSLPELAPISEQNLGTGDWTAAINSVLMCDLQGVYFARAFNIYFGFFYILFYFILISLLVPSQICYLCCGLRNA